MSDDTEDDRVGYRRPPKRSQFRKGQSGNPGGRPKKRGASGFDLDKLLDRSMTVRVDGEPRVMSAKEVELRQLLEKAVKKRNLAAIEYLIELFLQHAAIEPPPDPPGAMVIIMPNDLPQAVGNMAIERLGPQPWSKKELAPIKAEYIATRSELDRIVDEIMGYDL